MQVPTVSEPQKHGYVQESHEPRWEQEEPTTLMRNKPESTEVDVPADPCFQRRFCEEARSNAIVAIPNVQPEDHRAKQVVDFHPIHAGNKKAETKTP